MNVRIAYTWNSSFFSGYPVYHFYTIHHHFHHIPETPKRCLLSCGVHKTHPNSGAHQPEQTKSVVPKTHLCLWQISKTTMDLFTFRPSFTLDFCSHVALFRTSRLQSAKSTCTRLDESPGDDKGCTNQRWITTSPMASNFKQNLKASEK